MAEFCKGKLPVYCIVDFKWESMTIHALAFGAQLQMSACRMSHGSLK